MRPLRIVSLNWALSETLYAMDLKPIAAAEIPGYERLVGYPPTPPGVIDVGFQSEPNLELLSSLGPDVVLGQSWQAGLRPLVQRFAKLELFTLYARDDDPVARSIEAAKSLAQLGGQPRRAQDFLARADQAFADCRHRLAAVRSPPVLLIQALTETNLVVFGAGSLYDSTLRRLGLANAWTGRPDLLWGSTRIGVEALADHPEARIVRIASAGGAAADALFASGLWRALPQVAEGRTGALPAFWGFGSLPTAVRFARMLTADLTQAVPA